MSEAATFTTPELDRLAYAAGCNLEIEYDTSAPMPWAVWAWSDTESEREIIGAGNTDREAIEDARATVAHWCGGAVLP